MKIEGQSVVVTGAASGLGLATARLMVDRGANVILVDLPGTDGGEAANTLGQQASFIPADVTDEDAVRQSMTTAAERAPLRAVVHCAGRGGPLRILNRDGSAGSQDIFAEVVRVNLLGSFNVLRLAAETMARQEPQGEERGVVVLTASIAAFEGQVGQVHYASSKAGIVGMTLVAARDLAKHAIRVVTIAPGVVDTPLLDRLSDEVLTKLGAAVPHPSRLAHPSEFATLAGHVIENPMLNGETIRLDGALRMGPR